jgi:hypothetical protein
MAYDIGASVGITGEAEFKKAIAGINNEFKLLGSEMKLAISGFDKADKSTAALTAQNKVLGKEIDSQKTRISLLTTQYDKQNSGLATLKTKLDATKAAFAADSAEVAKAQSAYDKQNNAVIKLQTELNKAATGLNNMDKALAANNKSIDLQNSNWTKMGQSLDGIGTKMKTVGAGLSSIGKSLAMTVTAPIVGLGVAAVKMASDLSENMNKIDVAFKDNAQEVKDWSGTTLSSFGISQGSALEMASLFGDMGTAMGQSTSEASKMSTGLVGLAGDLASFKNIGIAQAQDALKGIFTGEGESLKSLGIIMQDSTLIAYAQATGQKKLYSEMTQAEKVALRYAFVMDATKNSQGDFARTSEGTANQMRIFGEGMKELGANIGTYLLPVITPIIAKMTEWVKSFGALDEGTKKTILVVAGIAAVIGPLLVVTGSLITAFGTIAGVFSAASLAIAGAGGGVAALELAFAAVTGPIGLAGLAIGGLVGGGVSLYKHLSADAIPAVQLFGSETSKATQAAVQGYLDLDTKATQSLMSLNFSGKAVSKETADALTKNFNDMGIQIKAGMDKHYGESLTTMQNFFINSSALTTQEEAAALAEMATAHESEKARTDQQEKMLKGILTLASSERRTLTADEQVQINAIQESMKTNAVKALSDTEVESKLILERMKAQAGEITAAQAAEVAKNSITQKDAAIASANACYDDTIRTIIKMRDETGVISKEQADTLILEAGRQKDETVRLATEMNSEVVDQAKKQAADHVNEVNWETGEIKSKWQVFGEEVTRRNEEISINVAGSWNEMNANIGIAFDNIVGGANTSMENLSATVMNGLDTALNYIIALPDQAWQWGANIIQGIADGFSSIDIRTPHFKFDVGWRDFGGISLPDPNVSVNWYDQGGVFNSPSIIGIGEKRPDFVGALDDLKYIVRSEIERSGSKGQLAAVGGDINITMPGMVIREEADIEKISRKLYMLTRNKSRSMGV